MQTFSKTAAFDTAWKQFKEHALFLVGLFVITGVILSVSGYIAERAPAGGIALSANLIDFALSIILSMGITRILLRVHDGAETHYPDLFEPIGLFWKYLMVTIITGLVVLIGLLLFVVPGIIAAIALAFAPYLVIDKKMGPLEALHESMRITNGHRWNLFVFSALVIGVNIIGALFLGLGLLLTVPVSALATVYVYRWLTDPDEESGVRVLLISKIIASIAITLVFVSAVGYIIAISAQQQSGAATQEVALQAAQQRDAQRIADVGDIKLSATLYYLQNQVYPTTLADLVPTYLVAIPTDPLTGEPYAYSAYLPEIDFEVCAFLEADPAGIICEYGAEESAYSEELLFDDTTYEEDVSAFDDDEVVWPPAGGFE